MLEYSSIDKIGMIRYFPALFFFASIFKQLVRNLNRNSFCLEKDNVSTSFTFSGFCFIQWCQGIAASCDYGTAWTFLLISLP